MHVCLYVCICVYVCKEVHIIPSQSTSPSYEMQLLVFFRGVVPFYIFGSD